MFGTAYNLQDVRPSSELGEALAAQAVPLHYNNKTYTATTNKNIFLILLHVHLYSKIYLAAG